MTGPSDLPKLPEGMNPADPMRPATSSSHPSQAGRARGARGDHGPAGRRYSHDPWVDRRCRETLERVLPMIESWLEPFGLRAVFLSGSAGLGEAVGYSGSARFLLSDLDLGAIVGLPAPAQSLSDLRSRISSLLTETEDPEVTLGVYLQDQLHLQVVTPGLVDWVSHPCVLRGDARWVGRFPQVEPARIEAWEAYRLIGNRCRELLVARGSESWGTRRPTDASRREVVARYLMAKLAEGIGTAWLLSRGQYRTRRRDRWERLDGVDVPAEIRNVVDPVRSFLVSPRAESWPDLELAAIREALARFFLDSARERGLGLVEAYEYDPHSFRNRIRCWRQAAPHRPGRFRWALRARLCGTPEVRELGAAVLYWLALPERPEPDWQVEREGPLSAAWREWLEQGGSPSAASGPWDRSGRLLGRALPAGPGAKERLRARLGLVAGGGGA